MTDPREDALADWNIIHAMEIMTTQELRNAGFDIEYEETLDDEADHYAYLGKMDALDAMEARGGPAFRVDAEDDLPF